MHPTRPIAIRAIQKVILMSHSKDEKKAAYKALGELLDGTDRDELECEGFEFCADCEELITEEGEGCDETVCEDCAKARRDNDQALEDAAYEYDHR